MTAILYLAFCKIKRNIIQNVFLVFSFIGVVAFCLKYDMPVYKEYLLVRFAVFAITTSVMRQGIVLFSEKELIHINNAPVNRALVHLLGFLKTHKMVCFLFSALLVGVSIKSVLFLSFKRIIIFGLIGVFNILLLHVSIYILTKISLKNRTYAQILVLGSFIELICESFFLTFSIESNIFFYRICTEIMLIAIAFLFFVIFTLRKSFFQVVDNSILQNNHLKEYVRGKPTNIEWNNSLNYMINKSILTEKRERGGIFWDFQLFCLTLFVIAISVGLSQTIDKNGNLLPAGLVLKISMLLYVLCLGALFGCQSIWQELSYSFFKLVPLKWYYKLSNIMIVPFLRILFYDSVMLIALKVITKSPFGQILILLCFTVSYLLVFMGIYITTFRILGRFVVAENVIVIMVQNALNILYTIPGLYLIIRNIDNDMVIIGTVIINIFVFGGLFYSGKSMCA